MVRLVGAEEVHDDVDSKEDVDQVVEEDLKGAVLVDEGHLEWHKRRRVGEEHDHSDVPERLELAIGHDNVPARPLIHPKVLITLLRHKLPTKQRNLRVKHLLLG